MLDFEKLYKQTHNLSVLFVEDYAPLREKIIEILEDFFSTVVEAEDGEVGLEKYLTYKETNNRYFDIVITDIKMPRRDGISLIKSILDENENQIIIVLSAHQETEYLMQLINLGISQFIPKPIEPENLLNIIFSVSKKIKHKEDKPADTNLLILDKNLIWNRKLLSLSYNNTHIELTKNERFVMQLLISNIDSVCSIDTIVDYFYAQNITISAEGIRNMMSRLRKKMSENIISNIYGLGYKLSVQH